uniref:Uncharacterized protein n=1 Tax=Manihot esculenta TaxID=3983 RepID=A0A2C9UHS1_MANES
MLLFSPLSCASSLIVFVKLYHFRLISFFFPSMIFHKIRLFSFSYFFIF